MVNREIRVLIVDDEPGILANLEAYLEDEDFTVAKAETGESAVAVLQSEAIDAAIIDMRLPDIDGNEVIRQALAAGSRAKFIIHTGSTEYRVPADLVSQGISRDNIFLKPVKDMGILSTFIIKR